MHFFNNTLIAAPAAGADWLTSWNSTYQGMPRRRSKTFPSRTMGRFPRLLTILGNHHCQSLAESQEARLRLVTDSDEAHYFFCSVTIPPTADSFDYESAILIRLNVAIDLVPYSSLGLARSFGDFTSTTNRLFNRLLHPASPTTSPTRSITARQVNYEQRRCWTNEQNHSNHR